MDPVKRNSDQEDELAAEYERLIAAQNAPMVQEPLDEPILLTKDSERSRLIYAVGYGLAGLIVEIRDNKGRSTLRPLLVFTTHQPTIFETLDMEIVKELTKNLERPLRF